MVYQKINILFLIVVLFCCFVRVHSKEEVKEKEKEVVTVYVTVSANSTQPEEATSTIEEDAPTPTVDVDKLPEYIKFEEVLQQTEDQCMKHVYVVSLNLFYANQIGNVDCENGHYGSLENLRKLKPCKSNPKLQYAIDYMDANFRLMCHTISTGSHTYEGKDVKKLCPIIQYMKTNYTKYEENLFTDCKKNDTCVFEILRNYKEIQNIRTKLKSVNDDNDEKVSYHINNRTEKVSFQMNITDSFFENLEKNCPAFKNIITSDALTLSISFSTIFIFSLFIIFIGRM
ncbi:hypothetical protein H8356DRAFT_277789 [Neocallimastix lanati (nom. inval.)]|jgi:hypothetical protein|uniref:Uncharacterized protein n=1 Tax=Neocallimastix californiae TaxID=1754190 RepID=A0A1Y2BQW3_9FUNG|nr:hypothetical protein H8356DRAFT_277789 [Neocallimastix sp. JGI-2020a]ORY37130.1 hypothetical protein LY90DRAFT_511318 [Neocallimastix californiae]|eukprot:ORY37130.1 hypothetical protein LY90DRAFT_511318 [Neocallimastix californiae]